MLSLNVEGASIFVGIDWAAETHAVCVQDEAGRKVAAFTIEHTAEGLTALVRRLARIGEPETMPVGIERPDGRLVDVLLEAGHPVVPVKPNAIKAWRDGEVLSGAKSDAADAEVIAEYLRLRQRRLHLATPYSVETKALRTVVRTRGDLVEMRVAATNQLSALLDAHWPGAKANLRRRRVADRPGVLDPLPDRPTRGSPGRQTPDRVLRQARLLRSAARRTPAGPAARRTRRHPQRDALRSDP
jgi:transposase